MSISLKELDAKLVSGVVTMSNKTLTSPTINGGTQNAPTISSAVITTPAIAAGNIIGATVSLCGLHSCSVSAAVTGGLYPAFARGITLSTATASGTADGEIWLQYTP